LARYIDFNILAAAESGIRIADKDVMGSINSACSSYLQSVITTALQGAGLTTNTGANALSTSSATSLALQPDSQQLSPFAQLMSTLQQLQQTDPAKYKEVTGQIATNLQSAAQTAQSEGNTAAASQLTQLSTDFNNASSTGQLPDIKDLAQAVGGHHHHHHGHHHSDASSGTSVTSSSTSQSLDQILSAFQSSATQSNPLDPMSIIMSTLSNAGITASNA
jgi:hypothetical protein